MLKKLLIFNFYSKPKKMQKIFNYQSEVGNSFETCKFTEINLLANSLNTN